MEAGGGGGSSIGALMARLQKIREGAEDPTPALSNTRLSGEFSSPPHPQFKLFGDSFMADSSRLSAPANESPNSALASPSMSARPVQEGQPTDEGPSALLDGWGGAEGEDDGGDVWEHLASPAVRPLGSTPGAISGVPTTTPRSADFRSASVAAAQLRQDEQRFHADNPFGAGRSPHSLSKVPLAPSEPFAEWSPGEYFAARSSTLGRLEGAPDGNAPDFNIAEGGVPEEDSSYEHYSALDSTDDGEAGSEPDPFVAAGRVGTGHLDNEHGDDALDYRGENEDIEDDEDDEDGEGLGLAPSLEASFALEHYLQHGEPAADAGEEIDMERDQEDETMMRMEADLPTDDDNGVPGLHPGASFGDAATNEPRGQLHNIPDFPSPLPPMPSPPPSNALPVLPAHTSALPPPRPASRETAPLYTPVRPTTAATTTAKDGNPSALLASSPLPISPAISPTLSNGAPAHAAALFTPAPVSLSDSSEATPMFNVSDLQGDEAALLTNASNAAVFARRLSGGNQSTFGLGGDTPDRGAWLLPRPAYSTAPSSNLASSTNVTSAPVLSGTRVSSASSFSGTGEPLANALNFGPEDDGDTDVNAVGDDGGGAGGSDSLQASSSSLSLLNHRSPSTFGSSFAAALADPPVTASTSSASVRTTGSGMPSAAASSETLATSVASQDLYGLPVSASGELMLLPEDDAEYLYREADEGEEGGIGMGASSNGLDVGNQGGIEEEVEEEEEEDADWLAALPSSRSPSRGDGDALYAVSGTGFGSDDYVDGRGAESGYMKGEEGERGRDTGRESDARLGGMAVYSDGALATSHNSTVPLANRDSRSSALLDSPPANPVVPTFASYALSPPISALPPASLPSALSTFPSSSIPGNDNAVAATSTNTTTTTTTTTTTSYPPSAATARPLTSGIGAETMRLDLSSVNASSMWDSNPSMSLGQTPRLPAPLLARHREGIMDSSTFDTLGTPLRGDTMDTSAVLAQHASLLQYLSESSVSRSHFSDAAPGDPPAAAEHDAINVTIESATSPSLSPETSPPGLESESPTRARWGSIKNLSVEEFRNPEASPNALMTAPPSEDGGSEYDLDGSSRAGTSLLMASTHSRVIHEEWHGSTSSSPNQPMAAKSRTMPPSPLTTIPTSALRPVLMAVSPMAALPPSGSSNSRAADTSPTITVASAVTTTTTSTTSTIASSLPLTPARFPFLSSFDSPAASGDALSAPATALRRGNDSALRDRDALNLSNAIFAEDRQAPTPRAAVSSILSEEEMQRLTRPAPKPAIGSTPLSSAPASSSAASTATLPSFSLTSTSLPSSLATLSTLPTSSTDVVPSSAPSTTAVASSTHNAPLPQPPASSGAPLTSRVASAAAVPSSRIPVAVSGHAAVRRAAHPLGIDASQTFLQKQQQQQEMERQQELLQQQHQQHQQHQQQRQQHLPAQDLMAARASVEPVVSLHDQSAGAEPVSVLFSSPPSSSSYSHAQPHHSASSTLTTSSDPILSSATPPPRARDLAVSMSSAVPSIASLPASSSAATGGTTTTTTSTTAIAATTTGSSSLPPSAPHSAPPPPSTTASLSLPSSANGFSAPSSSMSTASPTSTTTTSSTTKAAATSASPHPLYPPPNSASRPGYSYVTGGDVRTPVSFPRFDFDTSYEQSVYRALPDHRPPHDLQGLAPIPDPDGILAGDMSMAAGSFADTSVLRDGAYGRNRDPILYGDDLEGRADMTTTYACAPHPVHPILSSATLGHQYEVREKHADMAPSGHGMDQSSLFLDDSLLFAAGGGSSTNSSVGGRLIPESSRASVGPSDGRRQEKGAAAAHEDPISLLSSELDLVAGRPLSSAYSAPPAATALPATTGTTTTTTTTTVDGVSSYAFLSSAAPASVATPYEHIHAGSRDFAQEGRANTGVRASEDRSAWSAETKAALFSNSLHSDSPSAHALGSSVPSSSASSSIYRTSPERITAPASSHASGRGAVTGTSNSTSFGAPSTATTTTATYTSNTTATAASAPRTAHKSDSTTSYPSSSHTVTTDSPHSRPLAADVGRRPEGPSAAETLARLKELREEIQRNLGVDFRAPPMSTSPASSGSPPYSTHDTSASSAPRAAAPLSHTLTSPLTSSLSTSSVGVPLIVVSNSTTSHSPSSRLHPFGHDSKLPPPPPLSTSPLTFTVPHPSFTLPAYSSANTSYSSSAAATPAREANLSYGDLDATRYEKLPDRLAGPVHAFAWEQQQQQRVGSASIATSTDPLAPITVPSATAASTAAHTSSTTTVHHATSTHSFLAPSLPSLRQPAPSSHALYSSSSQSLPKYPAPLTSMPALHSPSSNYGSSYSAAAASISDPQPRALAGPRVSLPPTILFPACCVGVPCSTEFTVENLSDSPVLCWLASSPPHVSVTLPAQVSVPARGAAGVVMSYLPLTQGRHEFEISAGLIGGRDSAMVQGGALGANRIGVGSSAALASSKVSAVAFTAAVHLDVDAVPFGMVFSDQHTARTITVTNSSPFTTPVTVIVHGDATNVFFVKQGASGGHSTEDAQATLARHHSDAHRQKQVSLELPRDDMPIPVSVEFFAKSSRDVPAEDVTYTAELVVVLDAAHGRQILARAPLSAVVGFPRLQVPRAMQRIDLLGMVGTRVAKQVPVRNTGSVLATFEVSINPPTPDVQVQPSVIALQPGQTEELEVVFTPARASSSTEATSSATFATSSKRTGGVVSVAEEKDKNKVGGSTTERSLCLRLAPHGPLYQLLLTTTVEEAPKISLLCSRPSLHFGGMRQGENREQTVRLHCNCDVPLQLTCTIIGEDARLFTIPGGDSLILEPHQEGSVRVACQTHTPTTRWLSAGLCILAAMQTNDSSLTNRAGSSRTSNTFGNNNNSNASALSRARFMVALSGYGGRSNVVLGNSVSSNGRMGLVSSAGGASGGSSGGANDGRTLDLGSVTRGSSRVIPLTLVNTGDRAAFIRSVCMDSQSRHVLPQNRCTVHPDGLVLAAGAQHTLHVTFTGDAAEDVAALAHSSKAHGTALLSSIAIMTGDEILRHVLRTTSPPSSATAANLPIHELYGFRSQFLGEEPSAEVPSTYVASTADIKALRDSCNTLRLGITGGQVEKTTTTTSSSSERTDTRLLSSHAPPAQDQRERMHSSSATATTTSTLTSNGVPSRTGIAATTTSTTAGPLLPGASTAFSAATAATAVTTTTASKSYAGERQGAEVAAAADTFVSHSSGRPIPSSAPVQSVSTTMRRPLVPTSSHNNNTLANQGATTWSSSSASSALSPRRTNPSLHSGPHVAHLASDAPHRPFSTTTTPPSTSTTIKVPLGKAAVALEAPEITIAPHAVQLSPSTPSCVVRVTNATNQNLPFECIYPGYAVSVTPAVGSVPSRAHVNLAVALLPSVSPSVALDTRLIVLVGNVERLVAMRISPDSASFAGRRPGFESQPSARHNGSLSASKAQGSIAEGALHSSSSPSAAAAALISEGGYDAAGGDGRSGNTPFDLRVRQPNLIFPDTRLDNASEATLILENISHRTHSWLLQPVSQARVKGASSHVPDTHLGQDVFRFRRTAGHLAGRKYVSLRASFAPPCAGTFSQDYELLFGEGPSPSSIRLLLRGVCRPK